jgi:nitrite reductase/ring-hydroxylating ferredoxin subunit
VTPINTYLLALVDDPLSLRQLRRVAGEVGAELRVVATIDEARSSPAHPAALVIDLDLWASSSASSSAASMAKERWPGVLVAGLINLPDPQRWRAAIDAGFDLVTTRGALGKALLQKIEEFRAQPGGRRLRIFALGDIAGRVGLVKRIDDSPVGPVAVYHLAGKVLAVADRCPHAGARLSEGELLADEAVITCPRHGSRFDLNTGSRLRGPADDPIPTLRVSIEGTEVYLRLE